MLGDEARERYGQVKAQRDVAAAVVGEAEYLLLGFAVALAEKDLRVFKRRRVDRHEARGTERRGKSFDEKRAGDFRGGKEVAEAFQYSGLYKV